MQQRLVAVILDSVRGYAAGSCGGILRQLLGTLRYAAASCGSILRHQLSEHFVLLGPYNTVVHITQLSQQLIVSVPMLRQHDRYVI